MSWIDSAACRGFSGPAGVPADPATARRPGGRVNGYSRWPGVAATNQVPGRCRGLTAQPAAGSPGQREYLLTRPPRGGLVAGSTGTPVGPASPRRTRSLADVVD